MVISSQKAWNGVKRQINSEKAGKRVKNIAALPNGAPSPPPSLAVVTTAASLSIGLLQLPRDRLITLFRMFQYFHDIFKTVTLTSDMVIKKIISMKASCARIPIKVLQYPYIFFYTNSPRPLLETCSSEVEQSD